MNETICALATPVGTGGISIIRISGEKSLEIAKQFFSCKNLDFENIITDINLSLSKRPMLKDDLTDPNIQFFSMKSEAILFDISLQIILFDL